MPFAIPARRLSAGSKRRPRSFPPETERGITLTGINCGPFLDRVEMEMSKRIAVVGVGLMGSSLARHLLAAGFSVTVHDMDPAKVEAIVKEGGKKAASPDQIASQVDVVMLSLPNSHVVNEVVTDTLR